MTKPRGHVKKGTKCCGSCQFLDRTGRVSRKYGRCAKPESLNYNKLRASSSKRCTLHLARPCRPSCNLAEDYAQLAMRAAQLEKALRIAESVLRIADEALAAEICYGCHEGYIPPPNVTPEIYCENCLIHGARERINLILPKELKGATT